MVLPYIKMNPPQVYMCSPSWTLLPPHSPYHPSGSSQCTSPKRLVSCIEPGLVTRFIYDIIHERKKHPILLNKDFNFFHVSCWGGRGLSIFQKLCFCCMIKRISYMYTYIPSFLSFSHPIPTFGHHRAPSWAPCAIEHVPTSRLFYTWQYTSVLISQLIPPCLLCVHLSVLYFWVTPVLKIGSSVPFP